MTDYILTDFDTPEIKEKIAKSQVLFKTVLAEARESVEKGLLLVALEVFQWNRRKTACSLGMSYRSLLYKITQYGMDGAPPRRAYATKPVRPIKRENGGTLPPIQIRRQAVPEMVRNFIYKRDSFQCVICGNSAINQLVIDHKYPFSKNGDTEIENLQTLCKKCNGEKAAKI